MKADDDRLLQLDLIEVEGEDRVVRVLEVPQLLVRQLLHVAHDRQEVDAHDDVLARRDDGDAVGRREDVVRREHQHVRFGLCLDGQRQVHGHLVTVEVRVVAGADQRVDHDRVALDQHRLEGLDAHAVQRRCAVQQHGVLVNHLLEDVPHLAVASVEHPLGALDRVGEAVLLELADDERLVQFQGDLLRQAALVEAELRADHDDRPCRVVDTLAEQVLAEPALLALDHVGQTLERPV